MTENEMREVDELKNALVIIGDPIDWDKTARLNYENKIRKIPDGAVVISKEEYDDLKHRPSTRKWVETCRGRIEQARKEMAVEIFNKIKDKVLSEHTDDGYDYEAVDMWDIEDIFKEYGVEVEEQVL